MLVLLLIGFVNGRASKATRRSPVIDSRPPKTQRLAKPGDESNLAPKRLQSPSFISQISCRSIIHINLYING